MLLRFDLLTRLLLGFAMGLAGTAIWNYQGGVGPLYCAIGGFSCTVSGVLGFAVQSRFFRYVSDGLAVCGYTMLWIATILLWRELSFDKAGHYFAYLMILIGRVVPLLLSLLLLGASVLCGLGIFNHFHSKESR
jgi:hypothetical protein